MKRIFLIGYMGAGKTTVGKVLSRQMGLSFIDLDNYIEVRFHKTISRIFQEKGEEGFREMERKMLHEVAMFENVLISTGGGIPCYLDNMDFMNASGTTVYLRVSVEELAKRLATGRNVRPVLQMRSGEELKAFIAGNLAEREPFYNRATLIFDAEVMLTKNDIHIIAGSLESRLHQIFEPG
jgi:shikimate kinase